MPDPTAACLLTLDIEMKGNIPVVHCHGRLVTGVTDILYTRVHELIPNHKRIVLDLTDLTHMDSTGLGTLVRLFVSAKASGCSLELINLGARIRHLLGLTNLLSTFTIIGEQGITLGF
jgi:anti-sigma B factor antagonist